MQLHIYAKNTTLTPALESAVREKIAHLERKFQNIIKIDVQIEILKNHQSGDINRVEIMVHLPKKLLRAEHVGSEFHESLDLTLPKIEKQLEKYKTVMRKRDRSFIRKLGSTFSPFMRRWSAVSPTVQERRKISFRNPMTEEEAIQKLTETKQPFIVFQNNANGKISIVYQKNNQDFVLDEEA